jgi:hypothetical protein
MAVPTIRDEKSHVLTPYQSRAEKSVFGSLSGEHSGRRGGYGNSIRELESGAMLSALEITGGYDGLVPARRVFDRFVVWPILRTGAAHEGG